MERNGKQALAGAETVSGCEEQAEQVAAQQWRRRSAGEAEHHRSKEALAGARRKQAGVTLETGILIVMAVICLFFILKLFMENIHTMGSNAGMKPTLSNEERIKQNWNLKGEDPTRTQVNVQIVASQGTLKNSIQTAENLVNQYYDSNTVPPESYSQEELARALLILYINMPVSEDRGENLRYNILPFFEDNADVSINYDDYNKTYTATVYSKRDQNTRSLSVIQHGNEKGITRRTLMKINSQPFSSN